MCIRDSYTIGATVPNAVVAKVGDGGAVCIFVSVTTDVIVDVNGYFPAGTSLQSINPARVLETRPGEVTVDGQQQGAGPSAGGSVTAVTVAGRAGVPGDAVAAVLNVTVTDPVAAGYATLYPCGGTPPTASNINYVPGLTVANLAISKIGDGGAVCILSLIHI